MTSHSDPTDRFMRPRLGGRWERAFAPLAERLFRALVEDEALGAGLCVVRRGEVVVDIFGGFADRARTRPWGRDRLVCLFSAGKPIAAVLALQAVAAGEASLATPLGALWAPARGTPADRLTLAELLAHRSGYPAFPEGALAFEGLADAPKAAEALLAQSPAWTPGTAHGYHPRSYGTLLETWLLAATGEGVGPRLERYATAQGLELAFGLSDPQRARCVDLVPGAPQRLPPGPDADFLTALATPGSLTARAFGAPKAPRGYAGLPSFQQAVLPAMNLHGTAQGLAKAYAGFLTDAPGLGPALWETALAPRSQGFDPVLRRETTFGLGFMRPTAQTPLGLGPRSFGHPGAGGTLAFADPDAGVAFALAVNRQVPGAIASSPLGQALVETLIHCL